VTVRSAAGGLTDDDGDYTAWTLDQNCLSWNEDGDADGGCLPEVFEEMGLGTDMASRFDALTVLTSEVDGRWYLSPVATIVAEMRNAVAGLDADTVATMLGVPQFGEVDGRLEADVTVEGTTEGWDDAALYEMTVPAGTVLSTCFEGDLYPWIYGPDGRRSNQAAVLAADGGDYRVLVPGGAEGTAAFSLRPVLSSVEEVTVPSTVPPAAGDACAWRLLAFEATAGQTLLFGTEGAGSVNVVTPSGETVWGTAFVPEESGTHYLSVAAEQQVGIEVLSDDVLTLGGSTSVSPAAGQQESVRIFLPEGQNVRITVTGDGSSIPWVRLQTRDGGFIDEHYGSYYETAELYPYSPQADVYELLVSNFWAESGTFQVTVDQY
jgi:hypothetical protein